MSRRDTIIIAVLVNAALLMILFATAIRTDKAKEEPGKPFIGNSKRENLATLTPNHTLGSEDLLNELIASGPVPTEQCQQEMLSFEEIEIALTPAAAEIINPVVSTPQVSEEPKLQIQQAKVKPEEHLVSVTVKKGDFLEKIAKANNTTVAAIMKANNMSSTQLKIGQVLKVPVGERGGQKAVPATPHVGDEYYIVKEGDNPWLIANRNKIQVDALLRLNGLDEQKARRLRPGDKLKIR